MRRALPVIAALACSFAHAEPAIYQLGAAFPDHYGAMETLRECVYEAATAVVCTFDVAAPQDLTSGNSGNYHAGRYRVTTKDGENLQGAALRLNTGSWTKDLVYYTPIKGSRYVIAVRFEGLPMNQDKVNALSVAGFSTDAPSRYLDVPIKPLAQAGAASIGQERRGVIWNGKRYVASVLTCFPKAGSAACVAALWSETAKAGVLKGGQQLDGVTLVQVEGLAVDPAKGTTALQLGNATFSNLAVR